MKLRTLVIAITVFMVPLMAMCAAYKKGKTVMEKTYKVDITKMQWGMKDASQDRIIGVARLYVTTDQAYSDVVLSFDVFDKKAEKIGTIDVSFNFRTYGYRQSRAYVEGEFCCDIAKNPDARTMSLVDVRLSRESVTYQTTFNINAKLMRTLFPLPEPRAISKSR